MTRIIARQNGGRGDRGYAPQAMSVQTLKKPIPGPSMAGQGHGVATVQREQKVQIKQQAEQKKVDTRKLMAAYAAAD